MNQLLHTLRCVGTVSEERLASLTGVTMRDLTSELAALADRGLLTNDPGPFGGWSITDTGRAEDDDGLENELAAPGTRSVVERSYEGFLRLNPVLLTVCSDWQMRRIGNTPVLNDHDDLDYDVSVLDRLGRVHDEVTPVIHDLGDGLGRFFRYQTRLDSALQSALGGRVEAVADSFESYHSIWFQLHEDLLTTLGIARDDERRRLAGE